MAVAPSHHDDAPHVVELAGAVDERRRRLALDLSSAAGAAKTLVAGSAVKIATVTVVAGTALAVGPAVPEPALDAPAPPNPVPLQAGGASAEVYALGVRGALTGTSVARTSGRLPPRPPEPVTPGAESPPAAVPTPAAEPQPALAVEARPGEEPATVAPPPALEVEVPTVDLPALDPPALELPLPKLEVLPLSPVLLTADPLVVPSVLPPLP